MKLANSQPLTTRFAPAPTGPLHLGHVLSALYVWGIGRALKAKIILRIEDHDSRRSRPEYEEGILTDLNWLGLEPDMGVESVNKASSFRQSDRQSRYVQVLAELKQRTKLVYPCICTRKGIEARVGGSRPNEETVYDSHCWKRPPADEYHSAAFTYRLKVDDRSFSFRDLLKGDVSQEPAKQCGDFPMRDRQQDFSYQFCVSVDDLDQEVTLIVRGEDILSSTGRQLYLRSLLDFNALEILFCHHPLLYDPSGQKLSKSSKSEPIATLRSDHLHPERIFAMAFRMAGINLGEKLSLTSICSYFCDLLAENKWVK